MHKFQITGGKVTYRNRHLNREAEHFIQAENRTPGISLWNDPCGTLLGRAFSLFKQAGSTLKPQDETLKTTTTFVRFTTVKPSSTFAMQYRLAVFGA